MIKELWRPVVGDEDSYEVSNLGRVRSLDRVSEHMSHWKSGITHTIKRYLRGRLLRPGIGAHGYPTVNIYSSLGESRGNFCVHILVLNAFVGPSPPGMECRHLDGNRKNPSLINLCWGTKQENTADKVRHGTKLIGEKYPNAKLTDVTAREIRRLRGSVSQSKLAKMFNVSPAAIQAVHDGRTWKHV